MMKLFRWLWCVALHRGNWKFCVYWHVDDGIETHGQLFRCFACGREIKVSETTRPVDIGVWYMSAVGDPTNWDYEPGEQHDK